MFDVGVGSLLEEWVEAQGFDVLAVRKLNPKMGDVEILLDLCDKAETVLTLKASYNAAQGCRIRGTPGASGQYPAERRTGFHKGDHVRLSMFDPVGVLSFEDVAPQG